MAGSDCIRSLLGIGFSFRLPDKLPQAVDFSEQPGNVLAGMSDESGIRVGFIFTVFQSAVCPLQLKIKPPTSVASRVDPDKE
jgi:hypothetical protein